MFLYGGCFIIKSFSYMIVNKNSRTSVLTTLQRDLLCYDSSPLDRFIHWHVYILHILTLFSHLFLYCIETLAWNISISLMMPVNWLNLGSLNLILEVALGLVRTFFHAAQGLHQKTAEDMRAVNDEYMFS